MRTFIIASNNERKAAELDRILNPLGIKAMTAKQLGVDLGDVEETGNTFAENAYIKAEAAYKKTSMPAIADDSGLVVDALGGAPGVYSARYAGDGATDADRINKLLRNLDGVPTEYRTAHFVCSICCITGDTTAVIAEGRCDGIIAESPQGEGGFGYDPVFLTEDGRSFAQLSSDEKDAVSHRGRAIRRLGEKLAEMN